jgi:hypothetical protein
MIRWPWRNKKPAPAAVASPRPAPMVRLDRPSTWAGDHDTSRHATDQLGASAPVSFGLDSGSGSDFSSPSCDSNSYDSGASCDGGGGCD